MKTLTIIMTYVTFLCSSVFAFADNDKNKDNSQLPIIIIIETAGPIHGRSLDLLPEAYYMNKAVHIAFNTEYSGFVSISVKNLENGEYVNHVTHSSYLSSTIDISHILSSGDYLVEISYDHSNKYVGYFTL